MNNKDKVINDILEGGYCNSEGSENWYELLKIVNLVDEIIFISVKQNDVPVNNSIIDENTYSFDSVYEAKKTLDYFFYDGVGSPNGTYFTAWSKDRIYYPVSHDGMEWIEFIHRNPCNKVKMHTS